MVGTYSFLWLRLIDYGKKYQMQAPSVDSFNSALDEVQREAISILAPYYQTNEKVRALLSPFIRRIFDTTDQNGQLLQPRRVSVEEETTEEFYRVVSMGVTDGNGTTLFPIHQTMENEIALMTLIPQRQPNITKNRAYYINYDDVIQLYPEQSIPYILFYLIYPPTAQLAFTYSVVDGEYIQTFDPLNTFDLQWDRNASNLLLYMLLEKYGISSRDDLLAEFGKLGIQMTLSNPQA